MALWTIRELSARVASALAATDYEAPENRQIRAVPNPRTIRYYTTLGLVDRPADMRGRTALYDRRHLAQLVAIKRLQAAGQQLAEIQRRLAGATAADIEAIADLPGGEAPNERPARRDDSFWLAAPADPDRGEAEPAEPATETPTHQTIELAPGVLLVVDRRQHPTASVRALQRAAGVIAGALESQ